MPFRAKPFLLAGVLVLGLSISIAQNALAQTRLGLHVTQEELNIWRQRAVSGPYRVTGDVSTNSPGDWSRINSNAESFRSNPDANYWSVGGGTSCQNTSFNLNPSTTQNNYVVNLRDAAFKALINQDTDLKNKVRAWLLKQVTQFDLDFHNRTRWCVGAGRNPEWMFGPSEWVQKLLYAMDYIEALDRNVFTTNERNTMRQWFEGFAEMNYQNQDISINALFVDRPNGNYTPRFSRENHGTPYFGEQEVSQYGVFYNNRRATLMGNVGSIGVKFGNQTIINAAKLHMKEILRFGTFPNGYMSDFYRGPADEDVVPGGDIGWQYGHAMISNLVRIADETARAGDPELYNHTTSLGVYGSEGGNKNVLFTLIFMAQYVDHTFNRYATKFSNRVGDANYRIDGRRPDACQNPGETNIMAANIWYQNAYFRSVYLRQAPGTVGYSSCIITNGIYTPWMGQGGTYPGMLFLFGQMEGKVWPYSVSAQPGTAPNAPTNLNTIANQ